MFETLKEAVRPVLSPADVTAARKVDRSAEMSRALELHRRNIFGMASAASSLSPYAAPSYLR
jgi:hypothetical protein